MHTILKPARTKMDQIFELCSEVTSQAHIPTFADFKYILFMRRMRFLN